MYSFLNFTFSHCSFYIISVFYSVHFTLKLLVFVPFKGFFISLYHHMTWSPPFTQFKLTLIIFLCSYILQNILCLFRGLSSLLQILRRRSPFVLHLINKITATESKQHVWECLVKHSLPVLRPGVIILLPLFLVF